MKLKTKLAMIYVIASVFPIIIILAASFIQLRSSLRSNGMETLNSYLYQASESLDNNLEIYDNLFNYISYNEAIPQALSYDYDSDYDKYTQLVATVDPLLLTVLDYHSDINSIKIYTDEDFQYNDYIDTLDSIKNEPWYDSAMESSNNHWYIDRDNKKAVLASKMLMMDKYDIDALLVIDVDYDSLFANFDQSVLSNFGVFISDYSGNLIFEKQHFLSRYQKYGIKYKNFEKAQKSKSYKVVSRDLGATDWTVWVYKPDKLLITSFEPIILIAGVAIIASLLAVLLSSRSIVRVVTSRISKLQDGMMKVEKGDFTVAIEDNSQDEIGDLIVGFEHMLAKINALINEVYESKIKEKEYEMKALQAQINPHFLYNSLSLINWKAIEAGAEDISKMTLALSTFYRTSLNKGKNVCKLSDEIDNMNSYLSIQLMMHDNDFDAVVDVDKDIMQYQTLNLILQPLIENAIDHGIDVNTGTRGKITVTGRSNGSDVVLVVEDNGVGMSAEQAVLITTKESKGYGVRNVNERIKIFYGEQYSMKVESEIGKGTRIIVRFPKK